MGSFEWKGHGTIDKGKWTHVLVSRVKEEEEDTAAPTSNLEQVSSFFDFIAFLVEEEKIYCTNTKPIQ